MLVSYVQKAPSIMCPEIVRISYRSLELDQKPTIPPSVTLLEPVASHGAQILRLRSTRLMTRFAKFSPRVTWLLDYVTVQSLSLLHLPLRTPISACQSCLRGASGLDLHFLVGCQVKAVSVLSLHSLAGLSILSRKVLIV